MKGCKFVPKMLHIVHYCGVWYHHYIAFYQYFSSNVCCKIIIKKICKYGEEKWVPSEQRMSENWEMSWAHSLFSEWVWEECTHFFKSEKWEWEHSPNLWAVNGLVFSIHYYLKNLYMCFYDFTLVRFSRHRGNSKSVVRPSKSKTHSYIYQIITKSVNSI